LTEPYGWSRVGKILPIAAMLLVSCSQGNLNTATALRPAASPAAAITPEPPNNQNPELRRGRRPSPVPIETIDVSSPHNVSLSRFAPADAQIQWARPITQRGSARPQLVVTWERRSHIRIGDRRIRRPTGPVREVGLLVWQYMGHDRWRAVYRIQHRGFKSVTRAGPPGRLRRRVDGAAGGVFGIGIHIGDLTADGHPDVLTREQGTGSGGCSLFRVLASEGSSVRQIRFDETCDTRMDITEEGLLRINEATYREECESAHGCGRRIRGLFWTGADWEEVSSRREPL
jgi:hypothetical protein